VGYPEDLNRILVDAAAAISTEGVIHGITLQELRIRCR
jgi:hypothetical protein